MKGTVLFDNDYEFYQAATIDLRGFRDNRFIGKQSFYQYSDLRLDMGKLKNPFTPLKYGLFAGFDYGRVWFPGERSHSWHTSYGGGIWLTFLNKFTTKYSWFARRIVSGSPLSWGLGFDIVSNLHDTDEGNSHHNKEGYCLFLYLFLSSVV